MDFWLNLLDHLASTAGTEILPSHVGQFLIGGAVLSVAAVTADPVMP